VATYLRLMLAHLCWVGSPLVAVYPQAPLTSYYSS
jgi:hypothetical protein